MHYNKEKRYKELWSIVKGLTERGKYLIRKETILSKDVELLECIEKLDEVCKKILSNKIILAWIMKICMKEYKEYEIYDVASMFIEGEPEISNIFVHRDEGNYKKNVNTEKNNFNNKYECVDERILGSNTEDCSVTEGKVTYDIRFNAIIPKIGECIKLIINIEAQDNFYPGYPLIKRGFYYGCRMISAQYETEFRESEYGNIYKVYSIWICTNPPKYRQNTITGYSFAEENIEGNVKEKVSDYDLINIIMICLGNLKNMCDNKLIKLLNILFSKNMSVSEKKRMLENEFDIMMSIELETEVRKMCTYGEGIAIREYERGEREGKQDAMVKSIKNVMKSLSISKMEAMDILLIPEKEREKYFGLLID